MKQARDRGATERWTPATILMVALALGLIARVWFILHQPMQYYAVDELFDTLGWNLASLGLFTLDGATPSAHVGPLYPAVLATFYLAVGHRPEWVPYLHVACDVGTSLCLYRIGTRLFGSRTGAIAAAAMVLYPAYWTFDPRIRSESLLTLLMSAWLWATVVCLSSTRILFFVGAGLLAGLVILCKPVTISLAVVLVGLSFLGTTSFRLRMARAGVYLLACLLVVLPWTIRNYQAFGIVIPVSAGVGAGLWMGSDPLSRGSWPMPLTMEFQIWESAGIAPLPYAHAMYDVSTDRLLRAKGWARISEAPYRYLWLTLTRAYDFWIGNSYYLINSDQGFLEGLTADAADRGWLTAIYSLTKRLLMIPGLIGLSLWSAWSHRSRWRELLPLYIFPIGLMLGYIPFTMEAGRYALPVLPCLMVLSVAVLEQAGLPIVSLRRHNLVP